MINPRVVEAESRELFERHLASAPARAGAPPAAS